MHDKVLFQSRCADCMRSQISVTGLSWFYCVSHNGWSCVSVRILEKSNTSVTFCTKRHNNVDKLVLAAKAPTFKQISQQGKKQNRNLIFFRFIYAVANSFVVTRRLQTPVSLELCTICFAEVGFCCRCCNVIFPKSNTVPYVNETVWSWMLLVWWR